MSLESSHDYDVKIRVDYGDDIKVKPDIVVTRKEKKLIEIKIGLQLEKDESIKIDYVDEPQKDSKEPMKHGTKILYDNIETPQKMLERFKSSIELDGIVKQCW